MRIHYAHLVMLAEQGIIPRADARIVRVALGRISVVRGSQTATTRSCEDLFFFVDRLIVRAAAKTPLGVCTPRGRGTTSI